MLYKGNCFFAFYDKEGENVRYIFDNVREILKFKNLPPTRSNIINVYKNIRRAEHSENHFTMFLTGEVMTLFVYPVDDEIEKE